MERVRVALVFKDFAAWIRSSCVGLHVAGYATAEVLREHGIEVVVFPVRHNVDLVNAINEYNDTHEDPLTHVIISAPWLSAYDARNLIEEFSDTQFVILSHSNVGFLQADPWGVELLRAYQELGEWHDNLRVGGNSERFVNWLREAYSTRAIHGGDDVVLLPNLYPMAYCRQAKRWDGDTLKIGGFGAIRPYKNLMTAAGAAVVLQRMYDVPVEFHMSAGGDGQMEVPAIRQIFAGVEGLALVLHPWCYWNDFIEIVSQMDILLSPSYTESFNMITADGIACGVPSVVSPAITWAPESWKADPDDAVGIAHAARRLLGHRILANQGIDALAAHNKKALHCWLTYLRGHESWFKRLFHCE